MPSYGLGGAVPYLRQDNPGIFTDKKQLKYVACQENWHLQCRVIHKYKNKL